MQTFILILKCCNIYFLSEKYANKQRFEMNKVVKLCSL
jgi:hypothetical protein